jgi:hypothetical protein
VRVVVIVAGIANMLVQIVAMSERHIFGQVPFGNRLPLAAILLLEYAMCYAMAAIESLVAISGGFVLTSAAAMTLGSGAFAFILGRFSLWGAGHRTSVESWGLGFIGFCFVSNAAFLVLAVRYAVYIPRQDTVQSFLGGVALALVLPGIVARLW